MTSAHPLALDPDSREPTPLLILPRSLSPSHRSSAPKPILRAKSDHLDTPTTHISSLATRTARPDPHSLHTTVKGFGPYLNSYQQVLARLRLTQDHSGHEHASSQATAKPVSRLDFARLKVDELNFEVCFRCGAEREKGEIDMKEIVDWGLQWVCKGRCEQPDLARGGPDRPEFKVCFGCGAERDVGEIDMKDLVEWGSQWMCKGRCEREGQRGVGGEAEVEEPEETGQGKGG